jgi:hypothetical protein
LSPLNEGSATKDLLFVSDDKEELFYFTEKPKGSKKEKSQDTIEFNILDTLKCHSGSDVVPLTSTIFKAAKKESESFEIKDPKTQFLLRYLF